MNFSASLPGPVPGRGKAFYVLLDDLYMAAAPGETLPCLEREEAAALCHAPSYFFGYLGKMPCYCAAPHPEFWKDPVPPFSRIRLRSFFNRADEGLRLALGYGRQVLDLHTNFKFCGRCSTPTQPKTGEHARICPACGQTAYPRISPAVIMSVTRGDEILLARGVNFPNKEMFSVLAGFVSPSETLEECVRREVYEETQIRVDRVRYSQSQPWPFPDSLMIGFTAEYRGGEIKIDPGEIAEAAWFNAGDLPLIPDSYTLAGRLIRNFVKGVKG
ncbi:MAG: NAD(+) diphosphatase [Desulfobacter sp.]|nr:MAG: NAD(+) diphosphatase [Desulfobacter sp.]